MTPVVRDADTSHAYTICTWEVATWLFVFCDSLGVGNLGPGLGTIRSGCLGFGEGCGSTVFFTCLPWVSWTCCSKAILDRNFVSHWLHLCIRLMMMSLPVEDTGLGMLGANRETCGGMGKLLAFCPKLCGAVAGASGFAALCAFCRPLLCLLVVGPMLLRIWAYCTDMLAGDMDRPPMALETSEVGDAVRNGVEVPILLGCPSPPGLLREGVPTIGT